MAAIAQTVPHTIVDYFILFSPEIGASQGAEGSALRETMEEVARWDASSEFLTQTESQEYNSLYNHRSSSGTIDSHLVENKTEFVPRTDFGRRLAALRNEAIASGMRLLTQDEVLEEVNRRRGEVTDNDTDIS
jgi:hypothetical protein